MKTLKTTWPLVGAITVAGGLLALAVLSRYRSRIAYWV